MGSRSGQKCCARRSSTIMTWGQSRATEQGECKPNLRGDQKLPNAAGFFSSRAGAAVLMKRVVDADFQNTGERKQPDEESSGQGQRERNQNDGAVHVNFAGPGE